MKNLRMKAARAARNLSQQQLAELVGVSRQTINAIEYSLTAQIGRAVSDKSCYH